MIQTPKNLNELKVLAESCSPKQNLKRGLSENMKADKMNNASQRTEDKNTPRNRVKSNSYAHNNDPIVTDINELPTKRNTSPKQKENFSCYSPHQRTPINFRQDKFKIEQNSTVTTRKESKNQEYRKRHSLDICQTERDQLRKRIQQLSENQIKIDESEFIKRYKKTQDKNVDGENSQKTDQNTLKNDNENINQCNFNLEPSRFSSRKNGIISSYAANTNQGLVRKYNEDRVSIILNILKPSHKTVETWPKCAFFGIYDGHGGAFCADFLRDNLHQYVISDDCFPENPRQALINGFAKAEQEFIEKAEQFNPFDKSGSCAIVVLFVGDVCYISNVGDSRAILSMNKGERTLDLSRDHKPSDEQEKERIIEAGGRVYQQIIVCKDILINQNISQQNLKPDSEGVVKTIYGPLRTFPGRLSKTFQCIFYSGKVSRTFGDIEAKLQKYGGKPGVIIPEPEIKTFRVQKSHDFIFIGCDGIFDKLSSSEVIKANWESIKIAQNNSVGDLNQQLNTHTICAKGVEGAIQEALNSRSTDNLTGLIISFIDFQNQASPVLSVENESHQKQEENCSTQIKQQEQDSIQKLPEKKESQISQIFSKKPSLIKNKRQLSSIRRPSSIQPNQNSDRVINGEDLKNDKYQSTTPQSINNQEPQQRRFSLQFQTNSEQETSQLKKQVKAFNQKTVYDSNQPNLLKIFHSPVIVKKDLQSSETDNNRTSQMECDKNYSRNMSIDRQKSFIDNKVNCIQKKVNDLKNEKYFKSLFKERTSVNKRVQSAINDTQSNLQSKSHNQQQSSNDQIPFTNQKLSFQKQQKQINNDQSSACNKLSTSCNQQQASLNQSSFPFNLNSTTQNINQYSINQNSSLNSNSSTLQNIPNHPNVTASQRLCQIKMQPEVFNQFMGISQNFQFIHNDVSSRLHKVH